MIASEFENLINRAKLMISEAIQAQKKAKRPKSPTSPTDSDIEDERKFAEFVDIGITIAGEILHDIKRIADAAETANQLERDRQNGV